MQVPAAPFPSKTASTRTNPLLKARNRHFLFLDALLMLGTPFAALWLRLDGIESLSPYFRAAGVYALVAVCIRTALFVPFGLYNRYWRSATVEELAQIVRAVAASSLMVCFLFLLGSQFQFAGASLPRSLPLIDSLLVLIGVGGLRFGMRYTERIIKERPKATAQRVLIAGAGDAGVMIARELLSNPQLELHPIGFVDDDPNKHKVRILNLPVFGGRECIPEIAERENISQVIIAMPTASGTVIREFRECCAAAGVAAKTVPGLYEILSGKVGISQLRNVQIEDLLRREPIETDIAAVRDLVRGRRVLITGAGGSIGSELCRQVLRCQPSEMILVGHGENTVFDIQNELLALRATLPCRAETEPTRIHGVIADIRFPRRILSLFQRYQPEIVFHAAAHKHVPLMEANPTEAISNNVIGTRNLLHAALAIETQHFVMISTDKVVNPTSLMGASKRVAEMLVLRAARQSGRNFVAVRFGNVLGSRGSVVPVFKRQIAAGGPVTVSHPEMTRYFMTIPEAVQLVLQASVLGQGGEIFMLDMGEPVKIVDLAHDLIELSGLEVGRDIEIEFTGIRPGEKLFEELLLSDEAYGSTRHEKIWVARAASAYLPAHLDDVLEALEQAVSEDDDSTVVNCLQNLLPDCRLKDPRTRHQTAPLRAAVVSETSRKPTAHEETPRLFSGRSGE